jgi:hypothetical protein
MNPEQQQTEDESEDQRIPGLVFNSCTFNNVTISANSIYMDSYGYRTIGDITRLQELRFQQTTQQASASLSGPIPQSHSVPSLPTPAISGDVISQVSEPPAPISEQRTEALATPDFQKKPVRILPTLRLLHDILVEFPSKMNLKYNHL